MRTRVSLEEKIHIVKTFLKYESCAAVRRRWKKSFATQPPSDPTIRNIVSKFEKTGNVNEKERPGRPRSAVTPEKVEKVKNLLEKNPQTSLSVGAVKLGMAKTSYHRAVKESGFLSFHPSKVVELSDDDFDRREEFCSIFLAKLKQEPSLLDKIIWSDESKFMLNGVVNRHNCCYWATSNQQQTMTVPDTREGLMVWCGITSDGLIGPYFFDGNVTAESYLEMLTNFLWPQVMRRRMLFQQDGAPSHYALVVRNWLDEKFPDRWIGRRGPIEWPARSPDLSPPDFFLWGYLKDIVYTERPTTIEQLRRRIRTVCAKVPVEMCKRACQSVGERFKACRDSGGKQQL